MAISEIATRGRAVSAAPEIRVPSVMKSGFMILALKTSLKVRGYKRTIEWIRRRVEHVPVRADVDPTIVKAAEWWVAMAAAFYPGRAQCLERSLVLYYVLRTQGVAVRYCHGVQPSPLTAHAWIEYDGKVINDVPERVREFSKLPEQLP